MKKVYLPILLSVMSVATYAQVPGYEEVIERDVLGIDNIKVEQSVGTQVMGAVRTTKSADEVPVTMFVVSHEDIVRNGYVTLCDVLKMVPGLRVSQPQSGELGEAFMQRGMLGNEYTKILINGVETRPQGCYGMPLGANIPIRQAKEIQIVYGPASASFGNDACTGVINIETRMPEEGTFTTADIMFGTGNQQYLNFQAGSKLGHGKYVSQFTIYGSNLNATNLNVPREGAIFNRWNYFMQNGDVVGLKAGDITYQLTQDMLNPYTYEKYSSLFSGIKYYVVDYVGDPRSSEYGFYYPERADVAQNAAQIGVDYRIGGIRITYNFMHRMDNANLGLSGFMYKPNEYRNLQGEFIHRVTANADYKFGDLISQTSIRYISYRFDKNSSRGVNWSPYPQYGYGASDEVGAEENILWDIFKNTEKKRKLTLSTGLSFAYVGVLPPTVECERKFDYSSYKPFSNDVYYQDEYFGTFGINPHTYYMVGAYAGLDLDLNRTSLQAGTRFDYNSVYSSSWNPRLAALVKLTEDGSLTLRASSGWAYKTPSPSKIYYCVAVAMPNVVQGVPLTVSLQHVPSDMSTIKPESIWSNEIGLKYFMKDKKSKRSGDYLELVGFTHYVGDPIVRAWANVDQTIYPKPFYVGVTDIFNSASGREVFTRAYKNEDGMTTRLYGAQLIGVFKNIWHPINLGLSGALSYNTGHETLSKNRAGFNEFEKVDYVRHTPKYQAQLAVDFDILVGMQKRELFHVRLDNIYCDKFHRMYFQGTDNQYFYAPRYYSLDVSVSAKITDRLSAILRVTNVTNAEYGGIDVKNMDVDLTYNPQYLRGFRFGITYDF